MSRLLINLQEPKDEVSHYHVGDVIDEVPDDHEFTETEKNDPARKVVDMPGVPVGRFTQLRSEDRQQGRGAPMLRRRTANLDLEFLGFDLAMETVTKEGAVSDAKRAKSKSERTKEVDEQTVLEAIVIKAEAVSLDFF